MSNYSIAFDAALAGLRNKDPFSTALNADVKYLAADRSYIVPFFQQTYIVDCSSGEVSNQDTGDRCALGTGIIILNYLRTAQPVAVNKQLISLKEVPNGGMLFYPAFKRNNLDALVANFGQSVDDLHQAAAGLGGGKVNIGHVAARFQALPKVSLTVVLWAGDEEVSPAANILFDSSVSCFLPVEDIIGLGGYCVYKLTSNYALSKGKLSHDSFWDISPEKRRGSHLL